jgi:ankyrin repeat protein
MEAARRGNRDIVRALLSAKANPNAQETNGGQSALMWAVSQRHSAVVEELVRGGADVKAGSKTGFTPLMFAAQQGDVDSARILLSGGANPNEVRPKSGNSYTPLIIASAMGHADVAELLLDKGANPNAVDARGYTSLHLVVRDSDYGIDLTGKDKIVRIVKALLAHGANPNLRLKLTRNVGTVNEVSLQGATPLVLAAEVNNFEAVKALLDAGAPIDARDTESQSTPLHRAASWGRVDVVKLLLERGADARLADKNGHTALDLAVANGQNEAAALLRQTCCGKP